MVHSNLDEETEVMGYVWHVTDNLKRSFMGDLNLHMMGYKQYFVLKINYNISILNTMVGTCVFRVGKDSLNKCFAIK